MSTLAVLASCAPQIEYRETVVTVPPELLVPVAKPDRTVSSLKDVGLVLADYDQALDQANGQILAIDCILDNAADRDDPRICETTKGTE